jgi:DNA polymerase III alpha subunit
MSLKPFPTCHCHVASLDSASTPEAFVQREQELGTGTITITDHGTLGSCRTVYDLAKKNGLTPILGLEGYHRDDNCSILTSEGIAGKDIKEYYKYGHLTMHFLDQKAYEAGCRLLSDADRRAERHGSERKPLFDWAQLEELGSYNVTFTSGCLVGMVQRHMMADRVDIAEKYYDRLRSLVKPGNFYVELFPHRCDKNWVSGIFMQLEGEDKPSKYWPGKSLRVEIDGKLEELKAQDLVKMFSRKDPGIIRLVARKDMRAWVELEPKLILKCDKIEEFMENECRPWCPDGDVQKGGNFLMLRLAAKYGDPILISDDSHFANEGDKPIQDVRLMAGGDSWRFYGSYHRQTSQEAWEYFKSIGIDQSTFESWVDNSIGWASRFKDFTFSDRKSLPTKFYPSNTLNHLLTLIKKHGRMNFKDPAMSERLKSEIDLLHRNGTIDLLPYFFLAEEVVDVYRLNQLLTGPGRGSAAGLLITYLLGITHVNPLQYDLSQDRFMTIDRVKSGKLPDIDLDFPHRDLLVDSVTTKLKVTLEDGTVLDNLDPDHQVLTTSGMKSIRDAHREGLDIVDPRVGTT